MKLAVVCDDLIQSGGQEKLVEVVCEMYPEATLYASVISRKWKKKLDKKGVTYKTSFLQTFPFIEKLYRYYSPFFLHVFAFQSFNFDEFDTVLSISSRYAHHINTKPTTTHICYINSPGRMFWEPHAYFKLERSGTLAAINIPLSFLRLLDYIAAQRVDTFVPNAKTPQARVEKYYGLDSQVIYPFVDYDFFANEEPADGGYFLIITRLAAWKRVDLAVEACKRLNIPLKVIGEGPDKTRLQKMGGDHVRFLGYVSESEKMDLLKNCRAVINTQFEDFGIVPLEAMACGKPVVAFGEGGALETVVLGKTGEFFGEQKVSSLVEVLRNFDPTKYSPEVCRRQAKKFEKAVFTRKISKLLNGV